MATLAALLVCDCASRDANTGKWTLAGVFDAIWAPAFPAVHASLDVYFRLRAATPAIAALFWRTPGGAAHLAGTVRFASASPGPIEAAVRVERLQIEAPGEYGFELHLNGAPVGTATLTVGELPGPATRLH